MLSRTKTSSNKSIQDEIHSDHSKEASIITKKLIHTTFASIENCQMHKNSVCEMEKNDLKETRKQEKMQLENEISKLLKPECTKLDIIDLKNIESKVENVETKDNKSKSSSSIVLNEVNVTQYKMIPINKVSNMNRYAYNIIIFTFFFFLFYNHIFSYYFIYTYR